MKQLTMIARVLVGGLLVSTVLCAPAAEQKQNKVTKRDIGSMSRGNDNMDEYRGEILPGMVDDQVAEAFLKDAAREDEREERRKEQQEEEEADSDEDEGPIEVPLALPMARVVEGDDLDYAQEKPAPHRSKALAEDIYPPEDEAYLPYYPSGEVLFRRRRRSRAPLRPRVLRKRSPYTSVRDMLRPARPRSVRRKRQIRLSDSDLNALIRFLINVKVTMERASEECNNPQHHSFFREKELNEELGAGSGIDEDYSDEEQPSAPEQEYPVWLMPHAHQAEPVIPGPQRRSFYYPTLLPGQKRSGRYSSPQQRLENKLLGLHRSSDSDLPPRRFFQ